MHDPKPTEELSPGQLLTMRIIFGALVMGCLSFMGVAIFLRLQQGALLAANPWAFSEPLVVVTLAAGPALIVAHWIVPGVVARAALGNATEASKTADRWPSLYQTWFIVGQAMLEGAAFMGLVAYMTTGSGLTLGLALLCILLMALRFPTQDAYESFVTGLSS